MNIKEIDREIRRFDIFIKRTNFFIKITEEMLGQKTDAIKKPFGDKEVNKINTNLTK